MYVLTLFSRATSSDVVKIVNFTITKDFIQLNKQSKQEMERLRTEEVLFYNPSLFCNHPLSCNHPLTELNGTRICLHNMRKLDKPISYFLSDKSYLNHGSIFCFTETHTSEHDFTGMKEYIQTVYNKHL